MRASGSRRGPAGLAARLSLAATCVAVLLATCVAVLLAACGQGTPGARVTATGPTAGAARRPGPPRPVLPEPTAIVGVTTGGSLVVIDPATGAITARLVRRGVLGDEVSVSAAGTVYFAVRQGCSDEVDTVALSGGFVTPLTVGSLPAISPDGSKLAFAREPRLARGCVPGTANLAPLYSLVVRTLSSGEEISYPMAPTAQDNGLPAPISHVSWASDNQRVAVSISPVQDNEGWNLVIVTTPLAQYYFTGPGTADVPVTGAPDPQDSYIREGVFLADGDLFISRACCAGTQRPDESRLMWEVTTTGRFVRQVAIGYPNLEHTSLDVSANGQWLLYLAGHDLYVSRDGAVPSYLRDGLIAAAWG
jgi:hypothetical protein